METATFNWFCTIFFNKRVREIFKIITLFFLNVPKLSIKLNKIQYSGIKTIHVLWFCNSNLP